MVEAMMALVLCDHLLRQQGQCSLWWFTPLESLNLNLNVS
jgi:chorismate synthase